MSEFTNVDTSAIDIEDGSDQAYTLFAAFRVSSSHPLVIDGREVAGFVQEVEDVVEMLAGEDVTVHGWYDVSGMHHDADILVVLHGDAAEDLQWGLRELRRSAVLRPLIRVQGGIGVTVRGLQHTAAHELRDPADGQAGQWLAVAQQSALSLTLSEADDVSALMPQVEQLTTTPYIGRFIEIVEMIEVLQ